MFLKPYLGSYSIGVPPLPIPNREVKPVSADGTAEMWESRSTPTFKKSLIPYGVRLFFFALIFALKIELSNKYAVCVVMASENYPYGSSKPSEILIDNGPKLKRFRPRAQGRATQILKRTSHITAIVAEKE